MKVEYKDDKKEKRQSHEFAADGGEFGADCDFSWALNAYGSNKSCAAAEIRHAAVLLIIDIEKFLATDILEISEEPQKTS